MRSLYTAEKSVFLQHLQLVLLTTFFARHILWNRTFCFRLFSCWNPTENASIPHRLWKLFHLFNRKCKQEIFFCIVLCILCVQSHLISRITQLENKNVPEHNLNQFGLFMPFSPLFSLQSAVHTLLPSVPKHFQQDTAHIGRGGVCLAEKQAVFMGSYCHHPFAKGGEGGHEPFRIYLNIY